MRPMAHALDGGFHGSYNSPWLNDSVPSGHSS